MKKLTVVAVALALAGSAQAADMLLKAPPSTYAYNWSGIYVGANAGYGWADAEWRGTIVANGAFDLSAQPKGALAGGQIGINRQYGQWVLGAELTGDWSDLKDTVPVTTTTSGAFSGTTKLRDLETLTGRLGYAFNNVLFYGKAGGATGVVSVNGSTPGGVSFTFASPSQRVWGTTAGVGIEYGLTPNIILGAEYDFTRLFPDHFAVVDVVGNTVSSSAAKPFDVQAVTGRVSFKFN
jgi:outer membrane immunogenic protein